MKWFVLPLLVALMTGVLSRAHASNIVCAKGIIEFISFGSARVPFSKFDEVLASANSRGVVTHEVLPQFGRRAVVISPLGASPFSVVSGMGEALGFKVGISEWLVDEPRARGAYNPVSRFVSVPFDEASWGMPFLGTYHEVGHALLHQRRVDHQLVDVFGIAHTDNVIRSAYQNGILSTPHLNYSEMGADLFALEHAHHVLGRIEDLELEHQEFVKAIVFKQVNDALCRLRDTAILAHVGASNYSKETKVTLESQSPYLKYRDYYGEEAEGMAKLYREFDWIYIKPSETRIFFPVPRGSISNPRFIADEMMSKTNTLCNEVEVFQSTARDALENYLRKKTSQNMKELVRVLGEAKRLWEKYADIKD